MKGRVTPRFLACVEVEQRKRKRAGDSWSGLAIWMGATGFELGLSPPKDAAEQADGSGTQRGRLGWPKGVWRGRWSLFSPAADPYVCPGNQLLPAPCQSRPVRRLHDSQPVPGCTR